MKIRCKGKSSNEVELLDKNGDPLELDISLLTIKIAPDSSIVATALIYVDELDLDHVTLIENFQEKIK